MCSKMCNLLVKLKDAIVRSSLPEIQQLLERECLTAQEKALGLLEAVQTEYPEAVRLLLESGADVNYPFGVGTALTESIYLESDEVMSILLEFGADVSIPEFQSNYSPLSVAVSQEKLSAVKLLVEHGADVNEVRNEIFPLLVAVDEGFEDIFRYLEPLTHDSLKQQAAAWQSHDS